MYNEAKTHDDHLLARYLRELFADELYTEAVNELKSKADEAASGTALLSGVQALALKLRGKLMERLNLKFRESPDQLLESMAGFEVFDFKEAEVDGKKVLALSRTNGTDESTVYADMPDLKKDQILFVLEPFGAIGEEEKTWTEMTAKEREQAAGNIRNPSNMPKRMMKRRVKIAGIELRFDNRTGWIEIQYEEIEAYSRSTQELDALTEEFHPSKEVSDQTSESAKQDGASAPTDEQIDELTSGVSSSDIEDTDLHDELQEQSATSASDIVAATATAAEKVDEALELPE